jgi:rhodanese-related sulfurtransferase
MTATILPKDLHALMGAGGPCRLVDVRTPGEQRAVHVAGAQAMPLDALDPARLPAGAGPIHLLCQSGPRAELAAKRLEAAGLECLVVAGGIQAWAAAGLPVVRGRGVIALERQVRIGAGLLVLTGAALAWFVHPACVALCAFVGGGLLFAGVTGWCGMALMLALMPWNRGSGPGGQCG